LGGQEITLNTFVGLLPFPDRQAVAGSLKRVFAAADIACLPLGAVPSHPARWGTHLCRITPRYFPRRGPGLPQSSGAGVFMTSSVAPIGPTLGILVSGRLPPLYEISNDLILAQSMPSGAVHTNKADIVTRFNRL
jgi:hypothetical protein